MRCIPSWASSEGGAAGASADAVGRWSNTPSRYATTAPINMAVPRKPTSSIAARMATNVPTIDGAFFGGCAGAAEARGAGARAGGDGGGAGRAGAGGDTGFAFGGIARTVGSDSLG